MTIATDWIGKTNETDKIVKHACRTLFKQGHPDILKLYGLNSDDIYVDNLTIVYSLFASFYVIIKKNMT